MKMKRILSFMLCLCIVASVGSVSAFAAWGPGSWGNGGDWGTPGGDWGTGGDWGNNGGWGGPGGFDNPWGDKEEPEDEEKPEDEEELNPDENTDKIPGEEPKEDPEEQPEEQPKEEQQKRKFTASLNKYTGVYNGENHLPGIMLTVNDGDIDLKASGLVTWTRDDDMTNVGKYNIVISGKIGSVYEGHVVTLTYTVTPAPIYISANNASKILGQRDPALTYSVSSNENVVSGHVYRDFGENVGSYTIRGRFNSTDDNYRVHFTPATLTIKPSARLEKVCYAIAGLPEALDPGNNFKRELVLNTWVAYNNLSPLEKANVPSGLYNKLYNLVGSSDYAITAGSGSSWYDGKKAGLSFVAIDPVTKFAGIRVDGNLVDTANYSYYHDSANGTAVVTLKESYLKTLAIGKHDITICYWNGYASGYFYVLDKASSPPTGDTANFPLWGSMALMSVMCLAGAGMMLSRKKNEE